MSNVFTSLSKIEELTTEIVQCIAQYLDDDTLLDFSILSHTLRAKSHFTYGRRFFSSRNFCFHPASLQDLTKIANSSTLAKYVKTVSFGTGSWDLIDPVHDEDMKLGSANHGLVWSEPLDDHTLEQVRLRVDSSIIAQALTKLPSLKMVIVSCRNDWARKLLQKMYKDRHPPFTCVSGHCRPAAPWYSPIGIRQVFKVVAMSLEQMRPERLDLEIGLEDLDNIRIASAQHPLKEAWYTGGYVLERITYLKLPTLAIDMTNESPIYQILETAPIESLDVEGKKRDSLMDDYIEEMIAKPLLQLQSLQRFSVTKLWATAISFQTLFQAHQSRLTSVTITDCSVRRPNYPKFWNNKIRQDWLLILLELQKMAHLHFLHLEKLQSANTMDEATPLEGDQCLDVDMAIKAIWRSVEEIQIGLQNVLQNYCVLAHPFSLDTGPFPPWKPYLNLRYANLKVSPRYKLSEAETEALGVLRAEGRGVSPDGLLPAIFEVMDGKGSLDALGCQPTLHSQEG